MSSSPRGIIFIGLAAIVSVLNMLLVDHAYSIDSTLRPLDFFWWGFVGNALISSIFVLPQRKFLLEVRKQLKDNSLLILQISLVSSFGSYLFFQAMTMTSAGLVSVFGQFDVLIGLLFGVIFFKERISRLELFLIMITLGGFISLSNLSGEISPAAILIIVGSSFCYSAQSVLIKKFAGGLNSLVISYLRGIFIAIFVSIVYFTFFDFRTFPAITLFYVIASQLLGIFVYRMLYFEAHKHLGIGILHIFLLGVPVIVMLFGVIFLREPISLLKIIGSALVLTGLGALYTFHGNAMIKARRKNLNQND